MRIEPRPLAKPYRPLWTNPRGDCYKYLHLDVAIRAQQDFLPKGKVIFFLIFVHAPNFSVAQPKYAV
jgi:hypothetical protein